MKTKTNDLEKRALAQKQYSFFTPADAEKRAMEMKEADPDWSYVVRHAPEGKGFSVIEIYDENGNYVALLF